MPSSGSVGELSARPFDTTTYPPKKNKTKKIKKKSSKTATSLRRQRYVKDTLEKASSPNRKKSSEKKNSFNHETIKQQKQRERKDTLLQTEMALASIEKDLLSAPSPVRRRLTQQQQRRPPPPLSIMTPTPEEGPLYDEKATTPSKMIRRQRHQQRSNNGGINAYKLLAVILSNVILLYVFIFYTVDFTSQTTTTATNNLRIRKDVSAAETPFAQDSIITKNNDDNAKPHPAARGPNALSASLTPALIGAKRGQIQNCSISSATFDVNQLVYWNDPMGYSDLNFHSPFASPNQKTTKYLTFEPDRGGWNNVRMSMETMVVMAAAMGRTLVLPPEQPMYLLKNDAQRKQRGFTDFFNLQTEELRRHVPVITAEEFVKREGGLEQQQDQQQGYDIAIPNHLKQGVMEVMEHCEHRFKSKIWCGKIYDYYKEVGYVPEVHGEENCFIFDEHHLKNGQISDNEEVIDRINKFCGKRNAVYYDQTMQDAKLIHFRTSEKEFRILNHFYSFIYFTDFAVGNFYKRLIRDHVHYRDSIFCAAGKIIQALQEEGRANGFVPDKEGGGGGFSSMHIRRGDFQWKKMRISGEEWYESTKDYWLPNEILYITTDETNRTFFDPLAEHHELRFLDDYEELAGLGDLDPNYKGMIETIVASRGRIFVGTFFSSFSAYIGRMRGYHGMSGKLMWYGQNGHKDETQRWVDPKSSYSAREFPVGWVHIDGEAEVASEY